ncbi:MAG: adenylate kinase [Nanoarchaeota archaeon]|nr:adenylate kinase [Nanoarchaeota archaeon]
MEIIILLGPPGAGKGTQADLLAKEFDFIHLSTGDLLRQEIANQTEVGKIAEALISKGKFFPDDLIIKIVSDYLSHNLDKKGVILDGFPRTLPQARYLSDLCKKLEIKKVKVVNLEVHEEELVDRLMKRAKVQNRIDDTREIIHKRFEIYEKETLPLIDYYSSLGLLQNTNGIGRIEEIHKSILKIVKY